VSAFLALDANVPHNCRDGVRDRDLEDHFSKYGKIKTIDIKQGFAFVEYNDDRDASDAAKGELSPTRWRDSVVYTANK
jgi:hypothetical protein